MKQVASRQQQIATLAGTQKIVGRGGSITASVTGAESNFDAGWQQFCQGSLNGKSH